MATTPPRDVPARPRSARSGRAGAATEDDTYHCVFCGIHMFNTSPRALARHAAHIEAFAAEIDRKIRGDGTA